MLDAHAAAHRKLKAPRVRLQVVRHLIPGREIVARGGKRHPIETVELRRREASQRVPALAPRVADAGVLIEDDEAHPYVGEVIADGETRLAAADDDDVELLAPTGTLRRIGELHRCRAFLDQVCFVEGHGLLPWLM